MRTRLWLGCLLCLLCGAGAWFLWHHGNRSPGQTRSIVPTVAATHPAPAAPVVSSHGVINTNPAQISLADWNTNRFAGRLSNTTKSIGQLVGDRHAILLANALMDTSLPLNFVFPKNLQSQGDPGAYIVQARGPINNAFRAMLAQAGATMVAYIPNDAYLVRASASVANSLESGPLVQAVVPYEPYYKIQSPLLPQAVRQTILPDNTMLTLGLFADDAPATTQQIEKLGGQVVGRDQSPFGPVVRVIPPQNWTALATLPGVQIVEPFHRRALANDLMRATVGVAGDSLTATNYLGLTGTNIIVEVNDTGIDAKHPDFNGSGARVIGDAPQSLTDTFGHGTHVAGILAGDGTESTTVTNAPGSPLTNLVSGVLSGSPGQFRGMAPGATLYSVGGIFGGLDTNFISDMYFQEVPALTNALISNNSWVFEGDNAYDLSAASYDAAVRDALPFVTGSQPVLFVFAAGNAGNGGDDSDVGAGGIADSIESPATAKDVITVGATQEKRNITNVVTTINPDGTTNTSQPWQLETSTSTRVAGFSSRGNVGIGIEGTYGRYKPDVCAPGTFIVSTRSEQWDIGTYFYQDPTNNQIQTFTGLVVQPGSIFSSSFPSAPTNAVQLSIDVFPNGDSPFPFPNLPILVGLFTSPTVYDFASTNNPLLIPGDPNAPAGYLQQIFNTEGFLGAFLYAVSNNTANAISFDLQTDVITTNGTGDYFLVLSNLNQIIGRLNPGSTGPGPYYRYETGTSMSTPAVSGTLALMQEFYWNAYGARPSPAMLKAMLINGARATGFYNFQAQNTINYEGWGLINLPDSLPPGITNQPGQSCSTFIQDQSPTNALATGDSQTWMVNTTNALPLHVTLAWTDPPGDPAAAIKLVNNLVLVVTNLSNPTNPIVYYGNDIPAASTVNSPHATNTPPVFDSINNVQNVNLPLGAGTSFSVTVMGYRVNVNAVTAQTNNVVQDYALVISCGNGQVTNVMTVSPPPPAVSNPTGDQQVTYTTQTAVGNTASFQLLLNQFVGANSPLLGGNTLSFTPNAPEGFGPNNWQVTVGQTNQWHFYVITNTFGFSNAAFVTFNPNAPEPDTLATPRMGVFGGTAANASRDADIDMYVTTDSSITNLNPVAIANCVVGTQIGADPGANFRGASLGRGTTEFVVDTNAWSRSPKVYYVGVKSEDQMAAEYGFFATFSQTPFSQMNNGNQVVTGLPVPVNIPDGSPALPGKQYVFGIAIYPMNVGVVTVSDSFTHQNFGDLIGLMTLNGAHPDVLNNHDSFGSPPNFYSLLYDDTVGGGLIGSRPSDGPGNLNGFMGLQSLGVWMLTEADTSLTQTGAVDSFNLLIQPQLDLLQGTTVVVPAHSFLQVGFVDVPPGATNLTVTDTNLTGVVNPPMELFVKFGSQPTTNSFDGMAIINNPGPLGPWGSVSLGPPLVSGRYFVGLYNPSPTATSNYIFATIGLPSVPAQTIYSSTDTPIPILDDAVTTDAINVPDDQIISSMDVAIAVQHPRISDLVFHLISPDGTRELLMENRGGTDPNGAGGVATVTTNNALASDFEGQAATNYTAGQILSGWVVAANQVSVQTDPANTPPASNLSNYLALANGTLSANLTTVPGATYTLTFQYRGPGIAGWWRGERNANDIINNNIGALVGPASEAYYTNGVVGSAFSIDEPSFAPYAGVEVPDSPAYALTNSLSIEGWIRPSGDGWLIFWRGDNRPGYDPYYLGMEESTMIGFGIGDNATPENSATLYYQPVTYHTWHHVAATLDGNSGAMKLYLDGNLVVQTNTTVRPFGQLIPGDHPGVGIGNLNDGQNNFGYYGDIDEISLYARALSASEVQAIYADSTNGKFDPIEFTFSAPQSLAEAQVSVNGSALTNLFGNNTTWQTYTVSFTATQTSTPLQIQGIEPGMLLDAASVTAVTTNYTYLVFTENTNLTTTPIKFAVPPFTFTSAAGYVQWAVSAGGNGHWYKAVPNTDLVNGLTWNQADQLAKAAGGHLATITSQAENNFVFSNLIDSPQFFMGIGNNGAGPAIGAVNNGPSMLASWTWETGEPWAYTYWYPGNPNDPPPTRAIYFSGTQGMPAETWDDYGPNDPNTGGYVIERDSLPTGLYYLPEQSLDIYDGLNAQGTWTLEIQDDRMGATNPTPLLLSWQLRFNYVTFGTNANAIPPGTTATNVIPAGGWTNYLINVPANADVATNILVFATGPLNVWFNSATPPPPGNNLLLSGVINGTSVLSTFSVPTNIVPGGIYYIGLQNPNAFPVTNGFQVDFHYFQTTPVTPGVPVTNTVAGAISGDGVDYYSVKVPPDADYATNLLLSSTVPVNMWFNQTKPPVCLTPPDYLLIANALSGTNVLSTNSVPPLLPGSTYYLAVQNTNAGNATYALLVNFHHIASSLTNGVPTTNSVPTNSFVYYSVTLPTNADYATNLLLFASLPVNVWFNQTGLPTGTNPPDYLLIPNATSGISILSAGSTPPLVPGATYYLGVQNTNNVPVNFGLEVDFHLVIPIPITGPTLTATNVNGTNGFLLQWTGPTNDQYTIQWKTNLAPVIPWNTVSNPVINVTYTPTNGDYSWFDDGSLTGGWPPEKFYRVVANFISGPITNSTPTTNIVVSGGAITPLTVIVPANAIAATNVLVSASGPVNVWFNQTTQPTGNTGAGDVLMISTNTSGTFVLTGSSVPPLVPGANYYLGIQSLGTSNVSFSFQVNFAYATSSSNATTIPTITLTNIGGTNGILLTWYAPTNYRYQIQWTTALAPAPISWTTIPGVVLTNLPSFTTTNGIGEFQYFDNGSLTGGFSTVKFYRLIAWPSGTTIPPSLVITSVKAAPGGVQFQWNGSTNYVYDVAWTTNLALPAASWNVLSNLTSPTLIYSGGVFTFTDTNVLTPEFFRVLLLP